LAPNDVLFEIGNADVLVEMIGVIGGDADVLLN